MITLNNIEKQFVPYTLALKLKELGFDEPCYGHYANDIDHTLFTNGNRPPGISAPLWQQAFEWFRNNKNLCGEIYTVNMGAIDYTFLIRDLYSENHIHDNFEANAGGYIGTFNTYEEAQEACLTKLIEIVKLPK